MKSLRDRDPLPQTTTPAEATAIFLAVICVIAILCGIVIGGGAVLRQWVPVHGERPPAAEVIRR